jgi:hypothetical protein
MYSKMLCNTIQYIHYISVSALQDSTVYCSTYITLLHYSKIQLVAETAAEPKVGARYSHRMEESPHLGYEPETAAMDFRSKIILSIKPRDKISPHTLLGKVSPDVL